MYSSKDNPQDATLHFFFFFRRYNFREVLAFSRIFFPFGAVFDAVPPIGNFDGLHPLISPEFSFR
jgi:hypothetical protein